MADDTRAISLAPKACEKIDLPGGGFLLRSPTPLGEYPTNVCEWLEKWAERTPDNVYLAERDPAGGWRKVTYAQALTAVRGLAQGLLERGLSKERPVMILSDNSVDAGLLILASLYAGIPVAPISPAYSLVSQDHAKLRHVYGLVKPGLVYAGRGKPFEKAFAALGLTSGVAVSQDPPEGIESTLFSDLSSTPGPLVEAAHAAVTPDTVGKYLFTSGSTGMPKAVINTQRMMCSNQQSIAQGWPFLEDHPPVNLDWLPWNHTFGGNHNFHMVLRNGGSLYIDDGKPVPGAAIERTVRNLREVSPTVYFNVPRGYDVLLPYLEADDSLRDAFFKNLDMVFYAAAALPQTLWERIQKLAVASTGKKITMLAGWGSTETAPSNTMVHFPIERAGNIGLPLPGVTVKLLPNAGKLEIRVKGPNITPGYLGEEKQTREAFDEEGFYKIGDAAKLVDPDDPSQGLFFDGRVSEDFKLTTGTWVHVGGLRVGVIEAAQGLVTDAVVCGHNRDYISVMVWPNLETCGALIGSADPETICGSAVVLEKIGEAVKKLNAQSKGSSTRIERLLLLAELPNLDGNEITDKGYINQRATLERRASDVEKLYTDPAPEGVAIL